MQRSKVVDLKKQLKIIFFSFAPIIFIKKMQRRGIR